MLWVLVSLKDTIDVLFHTIAYKTQSLLLLFHVGVV